MFLSHQTVSDPGPGAQCNVSIKIYWISEWINGEGHRQVNSKLQSKTG